MRFKELFEAKEKHSSRNIRNISEKRLSSYIHKHCQPWLNATQGLEVYRGVRLSSGLSSFIKKTRTDRSPSDTEPSRQHIFNLLLQYAGSNVSRNNSIFCTGSRETAEDYGKVFVVFPIGNFEYAWSPKYADWTRHMDYAQLMRMLKPELFAYQGDPDEIGNEINSSEKLINLFTDKKNIKPNVLNRIISVNEGLPQAIKSGHEIMIKCEKVLYVDTNTYHKLLNASI